MTPSNKRPSFQFYPGDWLNHMGLRSCSICARGLWLDMLCLMHQGSPYGYLKVGSMVILAPNLARMLGATLPEVEGWLKELQAGGVYSIDDDGVIFSPRMVRDEQLRASRAAGGILGGNPNLKNGRKDNPEVGSKGNHTANLEPTPSSSSSSSINTVPLQAAGDSVQQSPKKRRKPTSENLTGFDEFWKAHPRKVNKGDAEKAWAKIQPDEQLRAKIMATLAARSQSPEWTRENCRYAPYPATWLNAKGWEDEISPTNTNPTAQTLEESLREEREQFLKFSEKGAA